MGTEDGGAVSTVTQSRVKIKVGGLRLEKFPSMVRQADHGALAGKFADRSACGGKPQGYKLQLSASTPKCIITSWIIEAPKSYLQQHKTSLNNKVVFISRLHHIYRTV